MVYCHNIIVPVCFSIHLGCEFSQSHVTEDLLSKNQIKAVKAMVLKANFMHAVMGCIQHCMGLHVQNRTSSSVPSSSPCTLKISSRGLGDPPEEILGGMLGKEWQPKSHCTSGTLLAHHWIQPKIMPTSDHATINLLMIRNTTCSCGVILSCQCTS